MFGLGSASRDPRARGGVRRYLDSVEPVEYVPDCGEVDLTELSLTGLADLYGSDKGSIKHNYTSIYESIISELLVGRSRKHAGLSIVEFGVACGASLRMWGSYLPSSHVTGIDVRRECSGLCVDMNNVQIVVADVTDSSQLSKCQVFQGPVDLIVDDASHISEDIVAAFRGSWKYLKSGGFYIVEDLRCTYSEDYARQFRANFNPNSVNNRESFLWLVDELMRLADARRDLSEIRYYPECLVVKKM